VIIATRHNQHAGMVTDAISAGKSVYVEKPLVISMSELKAIAKAGLSDKQILTVGYNRRYSASIRFLKSQLLKHVPYSVYYQVNAGFIPKEAWYQSADQGGRIIGEAGHFIDTLQYLLDSEPVEVFANTTNVGDMPDQDNCFITIRFSNNSNCVIGYLADGDKTYSKEKIMITGYRTNIEFDNFKSVTVYKDGKVSRKKFFIIDKGQSQEMSVFVDAVKSVRQPISVNSLLMTSYATIMAVESISSKRNYRLAIQDLYE
jgi:predicted dehydrogenase